MVLKLSALLTSVMSCSTAPQPRTIFLLSASLANSLFFLLLAFNALSLGH